MGKTAYQAAMQAAAQRVLASGWYVLGTEGRALEARWAERCGVAHGIGVGNGMDAIEIGLRGLAIGPGDEVITTPMSAFASVLAILRAGATPVLADIDPFTALLDPDSVARCVTPRTRAVLLVHLYGQIRAPHAWQAFCAERGLLLLEDCAQAHLARWDARVAGSFGSFGAYSFYPTKNLGAPGDAGMLVTNDAALEGQARTLRNYGQGERYHHLAIGLNSRLDELQAALLLARLEWLDTWTVRRRAIADAYRSGITHPEITLMAPPVYAESHVNHLFVVTCAQRDALQAHLASHGVQTLIHYPVPVHRQPPCAALRCDPQGLPHAERHAATCLTLPCHPALNDADVAAVIAAVNAFGRHH